MSASDLRAQLLKSNVFRSRIVEVSIPGVDEPLKVKVKQPSVEERNAIFAGAKVSKGGDVDAGSSAKTGALAIIYCARDPDTDEPVFTVADLDTLLATPAGGWVDFLAAKVMEVLVEAQEVAKK